MLPWSKWAGMTQPTWHTGNNRQGRRKGALGIWSKDFLTMGHRWPLGWGVLWVWGRPEGSGCELEQSPWRSLGQGSGYIPRPPKKSLWWRTARSQLGYSGEKKEGNGGKGGPWDCCSEQTSPKSFKLMWRWRHYNLGLCKVVRTQGH